jgi:hypothetical protein
MNISSSLQNLVFITLLAISPYLLAEKVKMHTVMDTQRNMPMYQIPLPADWKIVTPATHEDPNIIGPGGVKIYYKQGGSFTFSNDPYMQQLYAQSGQQMRQPINAQQVVQQDLAPQLSNHGLKSVRNYPLPEVAQRSQTYSRKLYKSAPSQEYFDAAGSEWSDGKGNTILVIVDQMISDGAGMVYWYYSLKVLEAPDDKYQQAKKAFLYGIVNTQDNPQQIQAYNLSEQQKTNQSWSQHNAKMQQNQQNFDRQQALHRSTTDAVNRSLNSAYESQNAASDRSQKQFLNTIKEESTVTNPYDGKQYQVDSGADQYWVNSDGEYIPQGSPDYNPNADPDNYKQWQQVEPEY